MNFNTQEEETQTLIINNNDTGVASVKVVEYMLSSMSNELLCKFPDNSAFDFDYTQSSIWSPLLPHPSNPSSPALGLQRKLSYDEDEEEPKKFDSCMFNCFKVHHKFSKKKMMVTMKRRRSGLLGFDKLGICSNSGADLFDSASSSPIRIKGWKKVLKAASKKFKKTMKKKNSGSHLNNGFSRISC
ncbi:hypothetical protein QVD17_16400 [Tagetes erecta]|uniref:Uncharacterized protein n=1 Tax=Tagetes erecta TaxID=13708 RepID=A0AAD8KWQ0_TARER|nr:hypothetical protein QVD17_16400 [Tagetes erecta]